MLLLPFPREYLLELRSDDAPSAAGVTQLNSTSSSRVAHMTLDSRVSGWSRWRDGLPSLANGVLTALDFRLGFEDTAGSTNERIHTHTPDAHSIRTQETEYIHVLTLRERPQCSFRRQWSPSIDPP